MLHCVTTLETTLEVKFARLQQAKIKHAILWKNTATLCYKFFPLHPILKSSFNKRKKCPSVVKIFDKFRGSLTE